MTAPYNTIGGYSGIALGSQVYGTYYIGNNNRYSYGFNVTGVTIPVIASTLVSVFSLWNPVASNVNVELVDTDIGMVLATTVVDTAGWYFSAGADALAGTFTTAGTPYSNAPGTTVANKAIPYSAYTHSGTPARVDIIGGYGATTNPGGAISKQYNGRLIVPPGTVISLAMSTAAGTASGNGLSMRWTEWPL